MPVSELRQTHGRCKIDDDQTQHDQQTGRLPDGSNRSNALHFCGVAQSHDMAYSTCPPDDAVPLLARALLWNGYAET
jgi:hypothetical protein